MIHYLELVAGLVALDAFCQLRYRLLKFTYENKEQCRMNIECSVRYFISSVSEKCPGAVIDVW